MTGEGTRVKDLVDLLLLAGLETATVNGLRQALDITFAMRTTHPLPRQLPPPPANWRLPFRRLAQEVQLPWSELDEAYAAAAQYLDVVLEGVPDVLWDLATWSWRPTRT